MSSASWRAGLGSRVKGPWCGSNALGMVPRHEGRPAEESAESTMFWVVSVPTPVAEGVGVRVGGGPTNVDRTGRQGWPLGNDVVATMLSRKQGPMWASKGEDYVPMYAKYLPRGGRCAQNGPLEERLAKGEHMMSSNVLAMDLMGVTVPKKEV